MDLRKFSRQILDIAAPLKSKCFHSILGLDGKRMIYSSIYDESVNTYKVKCGGSLEMWETSGWITEQDPYGWFMWYCRFYLGR